MVIGGFLLPLRTVTTIFDLPSRRVIFSITRGGWYQRSHTYTYSFADIAGIGGASIPDATGALQLTAPRAHGGPGKL
jgi:hypothetical protein